MSLFDKLRIPKRTHATNLTADELILFDVLYDLQYPFDVLLREDFCEIINLPEEHRHSLNGEKLWRVLDTLIARGLAQAHSLRWPLGERTHYGLTPDGGRLWELERQPDWNLFVSYESWSEEMPDGEEIWYTSVRSLSSEVAQKYWQTALDVGLIRSQNLDLMTIGHPRNKSPMIYWKPPFEPLFEICTPYLPSHDETWVDINWEVYEQNRVWWRHLLELGGLGEK